MGQYPRLSHDGSLLACRDVVDGKTKTFIMTLGGGAAKVLCEGCFVFGFFPANDAALVGIKPAELEKMDLRTGTTKVILTFPRDIVEDACVSPDGK